MPEQWPQQWRDYEKETRHGMVIVPVGKLYVATCLCSWWEPHGAMLDLARYQWTEHMKEV